MHVEEVMHEKTRASRCERYTSSLISSSKRRSSCPGDEIGIHVRLRCVCRKVWGFKSPLGHHMNISPIVRIEYGIFISVFPTISLYSLILLSYTHSIFTTMSFRDLKHVQDLHTFKQRSISTNALIQVKVL